MSHVKRIANLSINVVVFIFAMTEYIIDDLLKYTKKSLTAVVRYDVLQMYRYHICIPG